MIRTWIKSLQATTKDEINEVGVITTHSDPVKYELDKDLDEGKWIRVGGGDGADAARAEIMVSLAMYREAPVKPDF